MPRRRNSPTPEDRFEKELVVQLGQNIKALRKARKISRVQLTKMAELHETHLYFIEQLGANLQVKTLFKIARELKVNPGDLMPELGFEKLSLPNIGHLIEALERGAPAIKAASEFRDLLKEIGGLLDTYEALQASVTAIQALEEGTATEAPSEELDISENDA